MGERFVTARRTITETDIVQFAALTGDYSALHTDEIYARTTPFGNRIAHGLLGLSISSGLIVRLGIFEGTVIAFLGIEDWKFRGPIKIGDTVHVEVEIANKRLTRDGRRGVVSRAMWLIGEDKTVLQEGITLLLVACREGQDV